MILPERMKQIEQAALYEGDGYWEANGAEVALELLREIRRLQSDVQELLKPGEKWYEPKLD